MLKKCIYYKTTCECFPFLGDFTLLGEICRIPAHESDGFCPNKSYRIGKDKIIGAFETFCISCAPLSLAPLGGFPPAAVSEEQWELLLSYTLWDEAWSEFCLGTALTAVIVTTELDGCLNLTRIYFLNSESVFLLLKWKWKLALKVSL